ncbi:hypothetical protein [Haloarcula sebkhae]|uniref:Uncharacterized protein n=1 Tax=Haloarcula sebkhae TaxID=932660 RepID=A0ACC6VRV9_9EURY|nr:hypothetical protein [Haloarcula sebkhae]
MSPMVRVGPSPDPATDTAPPDTGQWRLRHVVGDCTHDIAVERRAVLKG